MKYNLVCRHTNEVVHTVDLSDDIGIGGARTYFLGTKKLDIKEFNKLWKVMTKDEYDRLFDLSHRQNKQYEWWIEEKEITDDELKF